MAGQPFPQSRSIPCASLSSSRGSETPYATIAPRFPCPVGAYLAPSCCSSPRCSWFCAQAASSWASDLFTLLVDEGQWSELCAPNEEISGVTCAKQEVKLQYIYSTSFLCLSFANVASGVSLDVLGSRFTICFGLVISILGNILLAFGQSTVNNGVAIIAGYSRVGIGGYGVYISSFQLVLLFPPEHQGRITSILSGLGRAYYRVFRRFVEDKRN